METLHKKEEENVEARIKLSLPNQIFCRIKILFTKWKSTKYLET